MLLVVQSNVRKNARLSRPVWRVLDHYLCMQGNIQTMGTLHVLFIVDRIQVPLGRREGSNKSMSTRIYMWEGEEGVGRRASPDRVKNIDQRVKEQIANINLVTLRILLAMNGPICFEPQQIPPNVVGHEEHFNKLKASILQSRAKSKHSYLGVCGRGGAGKLCLQRGCTMRKRSKQLMESILSCG